MHKHDKLCACSDMASLQQKLMNLEYEFIDENVTNDRKLEISEEIINVKKDIMLHL